MLHVTEYYNKNSLNKDPLKVTVHIFKKNQQLKQKPLLIHTTIWKIEPENVIV